MSKIYHHSVSSYHEAFKLLSCKTIRLRELQVLHLMSSRRQSYDSFECRCGGLYCAAHRYSERHDCTFDYRTLGAEEIRKNNPVVVAEKIRKI
ncbi:AN1-type zinc finger protein 6 [Homalodisca vitripennis]|nr:AN1-type zinc finger protein 6 [Homalodisca vitripennis]